MVLYQAPSTAMQEWMKKPESERKEAEQKMKDEWGAWMKAHPMVLNTIAVGKAKRVTKGNVADASNDIMISSYVEAESPEAAAALFTDHPHFGIPGATIEVMPIRPM